MMTCKISSSVAIFFFFQAEDGIRDYKVTGVQTCALPISEAARWRPLHFALLALVALPIGIWSAGVTARQSGSRDPGIVVVDEVLGQWIKLAGAWLLNWKSWMAAFCLFRLFGIWKPPPVRGLED